MKRLLPLTLALVLALSACASSGPPMADTPAPSETAAPTQTPAPTGPLVYTDYSQLTPYKRPQTVSKFTRRYPEFTDHLIPSEDYGLLIPFPGAVVTRSAESSWGGWMEDYNLYGLMTLKGEVVVDPVFSSAFSPSFWDEPSQQRWELDCLILQKVVRDENGEPVSEAAVCAKDGSWCTGFDYSYDWELMMDSPNKEVISLWRIGDGSQSLFYRDLVFLDVHTGEELNVINFSPIIERWPDLLWSLSSSVRSDTRYIFFSVEQNHYLFDVGTGEITCLEDLLDGEIIDHSLAVYAESPCPVRISSSGCGYADRSGWVIAPGYQWADPFQNGYAVVGSINADGTCSIIDRQGRVVGALPDKITNFFYSNGRINYVLQDGDVARQYALDDDLNPVEVSASINLDPPPDFTDPRRDGDWLTQALPNPSPTVPGGYAFWNSKTGVRWDFPGDTLGYIYQFFGDYATFQGRYNQRDFTLVDLNTGEATFLGHWSSAFVEYNKLTGEPYLWLSGMDGAPSELRTLQGDTLYTTDAIRAWGFSLWGDLLLYTGGDVPTTLTNWKTGELLFSWPLRSAADG